MKAHPSGLMIVFLILLLFTFPWTHAAAELPETPTASDPEATAVTPESTEETHDGSGAALPFKKKKPSLFDRYTSEVFGKFDLGAVNLLAGWTEIISEPWESSRNPGSNPAWIRAGAGFGKGVSHAVMDTAGGILNLLTSPVPQFKVPLPEGGVQPAKLNRLF